MFRYLSLKSRRHLSGPCLSSRETNASFIYGRNVKFFSWEEYKVAISIKLPDGSVREYEAGEY